MHATNTNDKGMIRINQTTEYGEYVSPVLKELSTKIESGYAVSAGGSTNDVTEEEGGSYDPLF